MGSHLLLVTGASGFLGAHLLDALASRRVPFVAAVHRGRPPGKPVPTVPLDLRDPGSIDAALAKVRPSLILHAAAMASVAECDREPDLATAVNLQGTLRLLAGEARWAMASTDLVFDGRRPPYGEEAPTAPVSHYGRTKVLAEEELLARGGGLVVRLPLLFGPSPSRDRGATDSLRAVAAAGGRQVLFTDEFRRPLHAAVAATTLVRLVLETGAQGLVHVPGPERISRYELGRRFVDAAGLPPGCILPGTRPSPSRGAERPGDLDLVSSRLDRWLPEPFPSLDAMLSRS